LLSELTQGAATPAADEDPLAVAKVKIAAFVKAAGESDVEAMMSGISENFEHYEFGDKEGFEEFMTQAVDMGYLEDLELDMDDAEVEQDGDTMLIYPVELAGAFGSVTLEFEVKQEDGNWMVIGMDISGM